MPAGLEAYTSAGVLQFSTANRLGRVLYSGLLTACPLATFSWQQVVPTSYAGFAWGYFIPLYQLDAFDVASSGPGNEVILDHINNPRSIYLNANKDPAYPSWLVYGVY